MNRLILGDCLEKMREIADCTIDSCVTDPPYGLGFMGKNWDKGVPGVAFWIEAMRTMKPGAHLLAFGGSRTYHRLACAIEDAGFEIRDQIQWIYGSGFPKSKNLDGDWKGWGTALKPAHEPIVLARKPLVGTVSDNVAEYGTGAVNIDGCRVEADGPSPSVERRKHAAPRESVGATGWTTPARPPEYNEQRAGELLGRWPANVIHDGSDEVLNCFPDAPGQQATSIEDGSPQGNLVYGKLKRGGRCHVPRKESSKSAARFFYCPKSSRSERGPGNDHPTVKPISLMQYLCRLVTPPGGVVLDPFAGSGTTGVAAVMEGFGFIGIEKNESYIKIAEERIGRAITKN